MLAVADSLGDPCESVGGSGASTITIQLSSTWSCYKKRLLHHTCQHKCTHSGHSATMWLGTRRSGGNASRGFVTICQRQRWWLIGVSDLLMCSGHKACAQISLEFQHRSSFQPKQHSKALGLCIGCYAPLPTPFVTLHELKHHNYYHNFYKMFSYFRMEGGNS